MPQNSITPEQKGQTVNLGGMMSHVEAVMQRFNSEVTQPGLQGKVDDVTFDSSTGELCRTKNGTSAKVCDVVTSGFRITQDDANGIDVITAVGSATVTEDNTNGIDNFNF